MSSPTTSQRYLSTRGGSYGFSFEETVLKGLAADQGLFLPEDVPSLPSNWQHDWSHMSFSELAFQIFSLYIAPSEIEPVALRDIIGRSYSSFRVSSVTPTVTLDNARKIHLLELYHGETFAFKDIALQFLGNLFEFFLVRRNEGKSGKDREHLTVVCATSGDTGSASIYGLRGKKDVSVFVMYPTGKVSPIQEAQMTTVTDENVHCLSVDGTFDDCQAFVKDLFNDDLINSSQRLAAVNSINFARILAQITYFFASYFSLIRSGTYSPSTDQIRFVVPTGNFGDILAGYFAKRMGLPVMKLVIACNENDILHRFLQTGTYEKKPVHGAAAAGGLGEDGAAASPEGVKETLSPSMDILVSSNFERLLWFVAHDVYGSKAHSAQERREIAGRNVKEWQTQLKTNGGFSVEKTVLDAVCADFSAERVSDAETIATIRDVYRWPEGYILDPHSAIAVTAALRSTEGAHQVALATAHPAKFAKAVEMALVDEKRFRFKDILPKQFVGMEKRPRRLRFVRRNEGLEGLRTLIVDEVEKEKAKR
ncbi:threonine synthase [Xanthoria calcicola]